ncbi:CAP domain-containing protein [Maribacter sp.]|uniref:CAP domain-containing protein n=1 Tax=Maribacter sp. TaxID=1897614 RepID=UPI0025C1207D|nr:CAP domain-containing protein [Maribacter sp.]
MKMSVQKAFLVLFVFVAFSCSKETIADTNIEAENIEVVESELLEIVNEYRASLGHSSLVYNSIAYEQANKHNDYMISKGNLSHDNFSARASTISVELNAEFVAENVAKDYFTANDAFKGWLASTSHKKTIEGEFTHTAVSVKKDSNNKLYFTQLFFR